MIHSFYLAERGRREDSLRTREDDKRARERERRKEEKKDHIYAHITTNESIRIGGWEVDTKQKGVKVVPRVKKNHEIKRETKSREKKIEEWIEKHKESKMT